MAGQKFLKHDAAGNFNEVEATQAGGSGNENLIPALDASGRLASTMMPTGVGAETSNIECVGALAAGDYINVYNSSGAKCRKADASNGTASPAHGFVLSAYTSGQTAVVYWSGINTQVSGLTVGQQYLSTTAGLPTDTAPSGSGEVVQRIGVAISATEMIFQPGEKITLA